ncbi:MAG: ubiquinol-cytochrome c reductase iron-sulfur subunit [Pseudomonadota bacterium]
MSDTEDQVDSSERRDFLFVATGAAGAVVAGATIWPLVDQMNPSADVLALASIRLDISGIPEGTQIRELWQGKPVFIRHRTAEEIETARAVAIGDLKDPQTDEERALDDEGKYLVMIGVCTHLGCVPLGDGAGDYNGWFCPCHGSHYDTSGRIRKGPAPYNLEIPPLEMVDSATIQIG